MGDGQERDVGVLDFVLISGRSTDFAEYVAGLRVDAGAVVFALCTRRGEIAKLRSGYGRGIGLRAASERTGGKETLYGSCGGQRMVRLHAANLMGPLAAGGAS